MRCRTLVAGCLQRHALVHVLAGRCGGTDAELSADVDDQAVRGGVEFAAAPHDDRLDAQAAPGCPLRELELGNTTAAPGG